MQSYCIKYSGFKHENPDEMWSSPIEDLFVIVDAESKEKAAKLLAGYTPKFKQEIGCHSMGEIQKMNQEEIAGLMKDIEDRERISIIKYGLNSSLLSKYPFLSNLLSFEKFYWDPPNVEVEISCFYEALLDKKTHKDFASLDMLPCVREYSTNPNMPDRIGAVPTYIIKDEEIKRLGLEYRMADEGYTEEGYQVEVRLKQRALSIKDELAALNILNPSYLIFRKLSNNGVKFIIYPVQHSHLLRRINT
jgi:hypothetical protein